MSVPQPFSCFLIGADSLLIECGDILLKQGHHILGVIASAPRLVQWARDKGLRVVEGEDDLRRVLRERPFDYLFSISHLAPIPADIVAMAQRLAINFHDGPLPEYAGLNTPSWGLMNREKQWGITWHTIGAELHRGDILRQRRFDVAPGETSQTLSTRCFEAAVETFGELLEELPAGKCSERSPGRAPQRYYSEYQRPAASCMIDFRRPAAEIEAMVRALDFGRHPNPMGSPKVAFGRDVYVVTGGAAAGQGASGPPGAILGADSGGLRVATGDGVLLIQSLTCQRGRPVSPEALAEYAAQAGWDRFDELTEPLAARLTKVNVEIAPSASHWVARLRALEPVKMPHGGITGGGGASKYRTRSLLVSKAFAGRFAGPKLGETLLAGLAAYLARVTDQDAFDVAFRDPALAALTAGIEHLVSDCVPLRVSLSPADGFDAFLRRFSEELATARQRRTWLHDEVARDPELRGDPQDQTSAFRAVALELIADPSAFVPLSGNALSFVVTSDGDGCLCVADPARISPSAVEAILKEASIFLEGIAADAMLPIVKQDLVSPAERRRVLEDFNSARVEYRRDACVHELFEQQVERTPEATALVFGSEELTYRQLNDRVDRLASRLRQLGVGPETVVGVCVERSLDLPIAILGTLKAGGACLPLDPSFPKQRRALMIEDASIPVILTQRHVESELPARSAVVVRVDSSFDPPREVAGSRPDPGSLAYVIYAPGASGRPDGVLIEHRNLVSFFAGMDQRIPRDPAASQETWLAVSEISLDHSVLELLWTLTRGFKVVVHSDQPGRALEQYSEPMRPVTFSLFFFPSNEGGQRNDGYDLLMKGAQFADRNGFAAVWMPERHFHAFGGLYPNPAVAGAGLASITSRVQIRAGSVVLPLHHPAQVAEDWAVVDNLSGGRVGLGVASGWQPVDFVLRPENYEKRQEVLYQDIDVLRRLWRGEAVTFPNFGAQSMQVRTFPRPVQPELPVWLTTAGNIETWRSAGRLGAHVLTHLLGQSVEEIAEKVRVYRQARKDAGHDPDAGGVSMMLHTFVGDDRDQVREVVRKPMTDYLASAVSLVRNFAASWIALKKRADGSLAAADIDVKNLSPEDAADLLAWSVERYLETSALFGTPEQCMEMVEALAAVGVDEIACLIDFGIDPATTLTHLSRLNEVREMAARRAVPLSAPRGAQDSSLGALIRRHGVTHMQCTPALAREILACEADRAALGSLKALLVGGEPLAHDFAEELLKATGATIVNMYGPTEATVWSSTQTIERGGPVTIGRPIPNARFYILDKRRQPVPIGVAGELYIGGDGVARGYLNRPQLGAERFVRDPFNREPDARLYRTGDQACFRPDGKVELLGRMDRRTTIRGHRVEPAEIEAELARNPAVHEAVVIAREDSPGHRRLVAYLTTSPGASLDIVEMREALLRSLPEFLVPSHFVVLRVLPRTAAGAIDRQALPSPESVEATASGPAELPANQVEQTIAQIWQEVLGIPSAGPSDNFFDLGGHSLLALKVHRRLREAFKKNLAITDLFRFPTIRALARFLGEGGDGEDEALQASESRGAARREMVRRVRRLAGGVQHNR